MDFNKYENSSKCTITVTNEVISIRLPSFIRVIVDCERVNANTFDVILDSPPPFKDTAWLIIECPYTTIPKVAAHALFGNVIRINSPYFELSTDFLLLGAFLYRRLTFFNGQAKDQVYNHLQFGHYDEAFNKILKDCNLPYYYKYGRRMEL